ncbi:MAG TPA: GNAT family N-acetyltransferase [Solirubrobacteraceae bacterium]
MDVRLRPIRPSDRTALAAAYDGLSPESRQLRFFSPKARLTAADLTYLTEVDGLDHVAWVAVDERDRILGVGRFVRLTPGGDTAEFAIVVGDPVQGRGIGSALAERLGAEARNRGIAHFTALVRADNVAVRRLLARIAATLEDESVPEQGVRALTVGLAA